MLLHIKLKYEHNIKIYMVECTKWRTFVICRNPLVTGGVYSNIFG